MVLTVEYGIYFASKTSANALVKILKNPVLQEKINSIFNVKFIEFSVYYIFFGFEHVSFKNQTLHAIDDMASQ